MAPAPVDENTPTVASESHDCRSGPYSGSICMCFNIVCWICIGSVSSYVGLRTSPYPSLMNNNNNKCPKYFGKRPHRGLVVTPRCRECILLTRALSRHIRQCCQLRWTVSVVNWWRSSVTSLSHWPSTSVYSTVGLMHCVVRVCQRQRRLVLLRCTSIVAPAVNLVGPTSVANLPQ